MMNTWAILKNRCIISVVATNRTKREIQQQYPDHEVADLYSLPSDVQQAYQFWNERP